MNETAVQDRVQAEIVVEEAPAAQLPAVRQERKPRVAKQPAAQTQYPGRIALAILKITNEIGRIQKEGRNEFQKYKYTRWEDINEKLSPLLAEHGLVIVQSEQNRSLLEENDKGSVLAIIYHFALVNEHGEVWGPVEWTAIARLRDQKGVTDDKAAAKCHTQAEKQFCIKQFKIRTDDYDDGDAHPTLPKKDARDIYTKLQAEIDGAASLVELDTWGRDNKARVETLPRDWQEILRERFLEKRGDLQNQMRGMEDHNPDTGEIDESAGAGPAAEEAAPASPPSPSTPEAGAAMSLEDMAREAAQRGEEVFQSFYRSRTGPEKATLRAMKPELEAMYPK